MKTLNLIGAGKLGQSLARLWHAHSQFNLQHVKTRSQHSAQAACDFIGAGEPIAALADMAPADVWLIATPDADIPLQMQALQQSGRLTPDTIVFHCSGALSSDVLKTDIPQTDIQQANAQNLTTDKLASVHPIHSFASPAASLHSFDGSFCGYEGHAEALAVLLPAFESIGAQPFAIDSQQKSLYHAASVMACNYLVCLMDASLECFAAAGVNRAQAQQLLLPITHQTLDNTLKGSPETALTGPISRGDVATVGKQLEQLQQHPLLAHIYQTLGQQAVKIARRQAHNTAPQALSEIDSLLNDSLLKNT